MNRMAGFIRDNLRIILNALIVLVISTQDISLSQITELSVDINEEYQTIDNFGASDCWSFQFVGGWDTAIKERIADLLFSTEKGIGLSAWRFNIGGGKENNRIEHPWRSAETFELSEGIYDWEHQSNETWFLHAAKERGVEQFIAFVNSPPARMTRSGYTNCDDGLGSTNLKDGYEKQYAVYLVDILKHFRDDENIEFSYISPVNEPQWEWNRSNQEGNRASNRDIKNIVTALYEEITKNNITTKITVGESGTIPNWYIRADNISNKYGEDYGNYLTTFCNDTTLNNKISNVLSGHSYWSDLIATELMHDRIAFKSHLQNILNNGWKYWQTEYCQMEGPNGEGGIGRDLTMSTALNVARIIHFDLTILNASAWQWWTAISPEDYKDGLLYTDYLTNGTKNIMESKTLWTLGNFSKFIRPGSKRIKCTGASDKYSILASAYKDTVNNKLIIVIVNVANDVKNISFSISGVESSLTFTSYITSDNNDDNLKEYRIFNSDNGFLIPERSVITLVAALDVTGNDLPDSPKLYNNYPNPFNSTTDISFFLPLESKISLNIYDSLGRKVVTLIDGVRQKGKHTLRYRPKELSSGLYLTRLISNDQSSSIKMIYVK